MNELKGFSPRRPSRLGPVVAVLAVLALFWAGGHYRPLEDTDPPPRDPDTVECPVEYVDTIDVNGVGVPLCFKEDT